MCMHTLATCWHKLDTFTQVQSIEQAVIVRHIIPQRVLEYGTCPMCVCVCVCKAVILILFLFEDMAKGWAAAFLLYWPSCCAWLKDEMKKELEMWPTFLLSIPVCLKRSSSTAKSLTRSGRMSAAAVPAPVRCYSAPDILCSELLIRPYTQRSARSRWRLENMFSTFSFSLVIAL